MSKIRVTVDIPDSILDKLDSLSLGRRVGIAEALRAYFKPTLSDAARVARIAFVIEEENSKIEADVLRKVWREMITPKQED